MEYIKIYTIIFHPQNFHKLYLLVHAGRLTISPSFPSYFVLYAVYNHAFYLSQFSQVAGIFINTTQGHVHENRRWGNLRVEEYIHGRVYVARGAYDASTYANKVHEREGERKKTKRNPFTGSLMPGVINRGRGLK